MPIASESESQASGEIPAHLNRWNWGAFLLNWIWGIGNSVWIALFCLIPFVNIVMMFVLGAKGSRWAWKKRLWRDEAHFRSVQRKWAIAGVLAWIAVPLLFVGLFFGLMSSLKGSEPYRMTMAELRNSPAVTAALGEDLRPGYFVTGGIKWNADGSGAANFQIPIKGEKSSATASSVSTRVDGTWTIKVLIVRIPGRSDPIVVINESGRPLPGGPLDA
ncbi:MAG: cytochrome c oxidase assembly factor Coa1 family protein [Pseudomonadota bacterium]|nr:cytochrome c oxidase assembly factor Coa1 family protein [Pseudomonadota bacterium]